MQFIFSNYFHVYWVSLYSLDMRSEVGYLLTESIIFKLVVICIAGGVLGVSVWGSTMLRSVFGGQSCSGQWLGVNHAQVSVWGSTMLRSVFGRQPCSGQCLGSTNLRSVFGGQPCSGPFFGSTMLRSVFGGQPCSGQCLGVNYA